MRGRPLALLSKDTNTRLVFFVKNGSSESAAPGLLFSLQKLGCKHKIYFVTNTMNNCSVLCIE